MTAGSWAIVGAALLAVIGRLWRAANGTDYFSDDAYYYAVIARNLARTGRFTFDGTALTNGFHPLMLWLESLGFRLLGTRGTPAHEYLGILAGSGTIFVATVAGLLFMAHRAKPTPENAALLASLQITLAILLVPRFTQIYLGGMESLLVLPLLALLGHAAWRAWWGLAGVAGALLTLARLDSLPYLVLPLALLCAWDQRRHASPIRVASNMALPAVLCIGGLLALYQWWFGSPMPIHGALKSSFPIPHFLPSNLLGNAEEQLGLRVSVLGSVAGLFLLARAGSMSPAARRAGVAVALLALFQMVSLVFFQKWSKPTPVWYLGGLLPMGCLAGALGLANVAGLAWTSRVAGVAAVGALALDVASIGAPLGRLAPATRATPEAVVSDDPMIAVVRYVRSTPAGRMWGSTDCGMLAFWTRRPFVNLDGLVNNLQYQAALRDGRLGRYLKERRVRYLLFGAWDRPQVVSHTYEPLYEHRVAPDLFSGSYAEARFYLYSYRYMAYSDTVRLRREQEIWRSPVLRDGSAMARFVVFDLDDTAARRVASAPAP